MSLQKKFVWIDLEMTGLDIHKDVILEIAVVVTDQNLNLIATGPNLIINQKIQEGMLDLVKQMHTESGLLSLVAESTMTVLAAEQQILDFLAQHGSEGQMPLCGNSIWQDKFFLMTFMPKLLNFLHYRIIDVSTIKELVTGWYGVPEFKKTKSHRALDDIKESIAELHYYRQHYFINL